jgi:GNAT superfamily N-acetyltransferase
MTIICNVSLAQISDCPALGRLLVSANEDTFRDLVPDECLAFTAEESAENWKRNFREDGSLNEGEFIIVAETKAEGVVGFAMMAKTKPADNTTPAIDKQYTHELAVLMVAPEWQKQGVGRLLVSHVAAEAQNQGASRLLVRVAEINPNTAFYERLGAVQLATQPYDWDGFETHLLIYGWKDLTRLSSVVEKT